MTAPATSLVPRRGPSWAGLRRRTATTAAVTASLFSTIGAVALAGQSHALLGTGNAVLIAVGVLLGAAAGIALVWRHRWPWAVWWLAVLAPLLADTDALAGLVALVAVLRTAPWSRVAAAVTLTWVAASVALLRDAHRGDNWSVLQSWRGIQAPTATGYEIAGWVPWFVAGVLVVLFAATGLLLRTRSALTVAVDRGDRATAQQRTLREEAVRTEERTRIARDMHDTLANRLTRISLLAGGLHAGDPAPDDQPEATRVRERAVLIHGTAHEALDELKAIVGVMRGSAPPAPPGVDAVPTVVAGARAAGVRVALTMDLAPAPLDTATSHVAYRLVQEGVTNVLKHAPGVGARVLAAGAPGEGLWVEVRNPLPHRVPARADGRSAGLLGLHEQVAGLGGRVDPVVEHGAGGAEFVLRGWLPWPG